MTISTQANVCFSQAFDEPWERSVVEFTAVNITGFRMVDPDRKLVKDFLSRWATLDTNQFEGGGKRYISVSLLETVYIQSFAICKSTILEREVLIKTITNGRETCT